MTVIPSTPGLPLLAFTRRNAAFRFSRSHTSSINRFVLAGFSVPFIAPDASVPPLPASRASLLHAPNSLTPGERELIATYVSSQNDCYFCQTVHGVIAAAHVGGDEKLVRSEE